MAPLKRQVIDHFCRIKRQSFPATLAREVRALEDAATVFPLARKLLLIAHSRLRKPAVPAGIEALTTCNG